MREKLTISDRFWKKINKDGPLHKHNPELGKCWVWTGGKVRNGYGRIGTVGNSVCATHRLSWTFHYGDIPEGKWVLHSCDNPECCRPSHLFLGDVRTNSEDCIKKGRAYFQKRPGVHFAKLSKNDVNEIRKAYVFRKITMKMLGKRFGVHEYTIGKVLRNKHWTDCI